MPLPKLRNPPSRYVPTAHSIAAQRERALHKAINSVKFDPMSNALNRKVGLGKYKNKTWKHVLEKDPFYVQWAAVEWTGREGKFARYLIEHFPMGDDDGDES